MANKVWVQASDGQGNYQVVIHAPTPAANNSAGVSWANALIAAGLNVTALAVGANGWQQTQAEHDAVVVAATTIEFVTTLAVNPTSETVQGFTSLVQAAVADYLALLAQLNGSATAKPPRTG